jgi:hypothetical protein
LRLVRSTGYKNIVLAFGSHHDADRGSVIESAEVPGPVFTEHLDLETVRKVTASSEFKQLRALVHERMRQRPAPA